MQKLEEIYIAKLEELITEARSSDIIIEAVLDGNRQFVSPKIMVRKKTAEEKLAEIEKEEK